MKLHQVFYHIVDKERRTMNINDGGGIRTIALWQFLRLAIEVCGRDAVKSGAEVEARYCLEVDGV